MDGLSSQRLNQVTMTTENTLSEELFARGALMGLHIGRWTAIKKMSSNDMLLEENEVDSDVIYLGHKKLLPKAATKPLVELEGRARVTLASRSMEFPIAGARFVTYASLPDVVARLSAIKDQWNLEVANLVQKYPALREQQLVMLDRQAQQFVNEELKKVDTETQSYKERQEQLIVWLAEQKKMNQNFYPKVEDLRKKFDFTWRMFTISALEGINELDVVEVQEAQERLRADLQDWVRSATASMHKVLGEAAANAKDLLQKNGKLTPRNLTPLFNAFESFISVDFTGKSTFQATIQEIKSKFLVAKPDGTYDMLKVAEGLSNDQRRAEFDGLLATMSELAVDATAEAAGVKSLGAASFGRHVELE